MNLSKFLHRGDSVKSNLRNEPFHRDLTRKPWVYSGNILNLFVLRCMDFSKENISVLSLHRTPKFSASVNISLASPVHCLLIIPISLLPSKELSCGNKISLQKSNTYLNTIQKPLQTWSMDIVTLSPLPFSLSNHIRLQNSWCNGPFFVIKIRCHYFRSVMLKRLLFIRKKGMWFWHEKKSRKPPSP